jgi:hypothetical protein
MIAKHNICEMLFFKNVKKKKKKKKSISPYITQLLYILDHVPLPTTHNTRYI